MKLCNYPFTYIKDAHSMSVGFGQLLILIVIGMLLFGNLPKIMKDLALGMRTFKETVHSDLNASNVVKDEKTSHEVVSQTKHN